MPRAGWCRECGEWVWVDADGGCQHGHEPECVGGIYDADEKLPQLEVVRPDFGVGDLPRELNQFNWGAFLLPLLWAVAYGAWPVVLLWTLMAMTPLTLALVVGSFGQEVLLANALLVSVVSEVIGAAIRLWIGANATRLLWAREHARMKLIDGARPRFTTEKYLARQRIWARVGGWVTLMLLAGVGVFALTDDPAAAATLERQGIAMTDLLLAGFWLVAQVGLGFWLAGSIRRDGVQLPPADGV